LPLLETFEQPNIKTLRIQVVEIIRRAILRGEFKPGDRIVEADIAKHLGISRGPIREAMRQLEQESLVTYHPHKGCFVTTLSAQDAWEIYTLRAELEAFSLQMSGGRVGEESLIIMESLAGKMVERAEANDVESMVGIDLEFHSLICRASGHKRLYQTWSSLNSHIWALFFTVTNAKVVNLVEAARRHFDIVQALRTGEKERACESVREHYLQTARRLLQVLSEKSG